MVFNNNIAARLYNERYKKFGRDIRTVGWGAKEDQILRFEVLFRGLDLKGKKILDVGCGLGDLVPYLEIRTKNDFSYIGLDVAEELVRDAKAKYSGPNRDFITGDIFSVDLPKVDISILSGTLSLKRKGLEKYARATLRRMMTLSQEAVSLNFLSSYVDYEAPQNLHYQPEKVFSWARQLSRRVNLIHDYPLYEFTIQAFIEKGIE